jgi:signal transduction histidine kinase
MLKNKLRNRIKVKKNYTTEPYRLTGNIGKLHQAFFNTLVNAVQAIENDGTIAITTRVKNGNISIEITDTGRGISEKNISKITDPFFTTKEPGEGTGLGLAITYNIIREHDGKLQFTSKENTGTTATIELPIIKHDHE